MSTVLAVARRVVASELRLYRSLAVWVLRRRHVPRGAAAFPYIGGVAVLLWTFVVLSALELVALHVILPWETVRLIADVLGVWGVVWMLGLTASFTVHPHLLGDSGLRVRNGVAVDVPVPWDAVATVGARLRSHEKSRAVQLDRGERGTVLNVVVASQTNVDIGLSRPLLVRLPTGEETITGLRLYADDARAVVAQVREQLAFRGGTRQ